MARTYDSQRIRDLREAERQLDEQHRQLALAIAAILALYATRNAQGERIIPMTRRLRDAMYLAIWTRVIKPFYVGVAADPFAALASSPFARLITASVEKAVKLQADRQVAILKRTVADQTVLHWLTGPRINQISPFDTLQNYRQWRDPNGFVLSDRVERAAVDVRMRVRRLLDHHIPQGLSLERVTALLTAYLTKGSKGLPRNAPYGQEGGYAARRLLRNEILHAGGAAMVALTAANPVVDRVQWLLNPAHRCCDICDEYAVGGLEGNGVYPTDDAPPFPAHPNCVCRLQPVTMANPAQAVDEWRREITRNTVRARMLRGAFNPQFAVDALMAGATDDIPELQAA